MLTAKQIFPWWRVSPHRNLALTMAMDLSARTGEAVQLPVDTASLRAPARA
jgi:hypothetical protein